MNTDCRECRRLFDGYLDGELSREEQSLISGHMQICSSCREALQRETDIITMFDLLPEVECPESVIDNIRETVRSRKNSPFLPWAAKRLAQLFSRPLVPVAAAAAIIAFLVFRGTLLETKRSGRTDMTGISYSTGELQRARASAKWTLGFTARQLNDAEAEATRAVLLDHLPGAMKMSIKSSVRELPGGAV